MEGMIVSNEPGYYEDGGFGVRIENLMTITKAATEHQFGGEPFLTFDCLTMVPIQRKMIDQTVGRRPGARVCFDCLTMVPLQDDRSDRELPP